MGLGEGRVGGSSSADQARASRSKSHSRLPTSMPPIAHVRRLGFKVFDEPKNRPWGKRDAGILDPEGNEIYFSQPVE
jgi:hypothetical protein